MLKEMTRGNESDLTTELGANVNVLRNFVRSMRGNWWWAIEDGVLSLIKSIIRQRVICQSSSKLQSLDYFSIFGMVLDGLLLTSMTLQFALRIYSMNSKLQI